jgi:hypothetical protein
VFGNLAIMPFLPSFGRPDALNWILNVVSNPPKNAKSMVYSWWTPRTNWAGKREDASQSIRVGIQEELFIQVIGEVQNMAVDMDTFS